MEDKKGISPSITSMLKGIEGFVAGKSVVGEPITVGDAVVLPLLDVSFGCAAGATEGKEKKRDGEAGGLSGKITTSALLIIQNGTTKLVNVRNTDNLSKIIDMVPELVQKITTGKEKKVTVTEEEVKKAADL